MNIILKLLVLSVLLSTGCDSKKSSSGESSRQITVDDLAWSTDWKFYKWKISDLTNKDLSRIQVVVIGPQGDVTQEGASVGYDSVLDANMEITLALKKTGSDIEIRLRGGGGTVSTTIRDVFTGNTWSYGPDRGAHQEFLVVATDSSTGVMNSQSALAKSGNKLCLKLIPFNSQKEQVIPPNGP
jgi:hypothetical protein